MDFDIVVFCPKFNTGDYTYKEYQGKKLFNEDISFEIVEQFEHWQKEIQDFLKEGKTIFLVTDAKQDFFIHTGKREYSGTGRNTRTTNIVAPKHNYDFLEIGDIFNANGKKIFFNGNASLASFYKRFRDNLEFRVYFENITGNSVFTGKNKEKTVGAIYNIEKGHIVTLPFISYENDAFVEIKDGKEFWTKEATKFGRNLINCFIEIDSSLSSQRSKSAVPEWTLSEEYKNIKEKEITEKINSNNQEIKKLKHKNEKLHKDLCKEQELKDLLFEKDKTLENIVSKALEILGYKVEKYDNGIYEFDQVIVFPENHRYIGECEGKDNKAINIDKYRQLADNINADLSREDIEEKAFGILFGNPQRLTDIKERSFDFTDKCIKAAQRDKIALVKTSDLFFVTKYLYENNDKDFRKACRKAIYEGLGNIVKFPDVPKNKLNRNKID
jgi:hypothetical protein